MPPCKTIYPSQENDETSWENISIFLDNFKCAKIQGSNHFETYVVKKNTKLILSCLTIK